MISFKHIKTLCVLLKVPFIHFYTEKFDTYVTQILNMIKQFIRSRLLALSTSSSMSTHTSVFRLPYFFTFTLTWLTCSFGCIQNIKGCIHQTLDFRCGRGLHLGHSRPLKEMLVKWLTLRIVRPLKWCFGALCKSICHWCWTPKKSEYLRRQVEIVSWN